MTAVSPEHPERKDGGLLCWSGLSALRIEALWCLGFRLQGLRVSVKIVLMGV